MVDLCRPYAIYQGAGPTIQAYIPREMLDEMLPVPRDMHGKRLEGSAARILKDLMQSLTSGLPQMPTAEAFDVAKSTMHLVAASLSGGASSVERARPAMEASVLRQACRFIEMHLAEPDLGVAHVCAALKISRASLYRLFEPYDGVSCHIRERRLARIHGLIAGPKQQSFASLAEGHGFKSATHFSQAFREHYGYSPRDARAMLEVAKPLPKRTRDAEATYSLAEWLRPLRG